MDGKRIRAFYANATAWSFDSDAEPHIVALREKQVSEFDAWLSAMLAVARREGQAEAWEAGAQAQAATYGMDKDTGPNPYRTGADQ